MVTLATFATALPLGLCLALGRRSRLPVVRWLCAAFVEGMRSVPLLARAVHRGDAVAAVPAAPAGTSTCSRARVIAFALFNAAMAAEVFRGGLQSVGRGQLEAATTVGLSDFAALRLIVLPQAVTAVVPALVNIMIAVIKETTLLSVIGVNDLLGAVENGAKSPDWIGESNILTSGHVFLALAYLAVCYGSVALQPAAGNPALNAPRMTASRVYRQPRAQSCGCMRINKWYGSDSMRCATSTSQSRRVSGS